MLYHPMVTCFKQFIRRIRGDRERIRTISRLPLPFLVETDIDEHLLKFPGTTARVLYCIMRAPAQKTRNVEERELVFEWFLAKSLSVSPFYWLTTWASEKFFPNSIEKQPVLQRECRISVHLLSFWYKSTISTFLGRYSLREYSFGY